MPRLVQKSDHSLCNVWGPGDGPLEMYFEKNKKKEKRERQREIFAGEWTYKEKVR